jgi:hypothetical protein
MNVCMYVCAYERGGGDIGSRVRARAQLSTLRAPTAAVLEAPLPPRLVQRAERKAATKLTNAELGKWTPIVQANRQVHTHTLSLSLSVCLSVCLSIYLSVCLSLSRAHAHARFCAYLYKCVCSERDENGRGGRPGGPSSISYAARAARASVQRGTGGHPPGLSPTHGP